ncbi:hypothetical protein SOM22_16840 [Stenotrophomonas rhizophila]|uniref:hypothetical protein n=1 Tax=Stenotrophomonas TaxID=40323 RepID=UPI000C99CC48|nr:MULTISPECIES: hypothetical protein [Stenotrophomonas]MDY0956247.1 hypothetical protein [Stenotrophomonas rhizophila]
MNKYEMLFDDIVLKTDQGAITWKQVRKDAHSDLIFNASRAFRQYSGNYERDGQNYEVIIVEKKADDPDHDYAYERYMPELLVVDGNELLVTLTDSVIEKSQLIELVKEVELKNDKVKKLFSM